MNFHTDLQKKKHRYRHKWRTHYYQSLALFILVKAKLSDMKQAVHCTEGWFVRTKAAHVRGIGCNFKDGLPSLSEKNQICHNTSTHPGPIVDYSRPGSKIPHLGYLLLSLQNSM